MAVVSVRARYTDQVVLEEFLVNLFGWGTVTILVRIDSFFVPRRILDYRLTMYSLTADDTIATYLENLPKLDTTPAANASRADKSSFRSSKHKWHSEWRRLQNIIEMAGHLKCFAME